MTPSRRHPITPSSLSSIRTLVLLLAISSDILPAAECRLSLKLSSPSSHHDRISVLFKGIPRGGDADESVESVEGVEDLTASDPLLALGTEEEPVIDMLQSESGSDTASDTASTPASSSSEEEALSIPTIEGDDRKREPFLRDTLRNTLSSSTSKADSWKNTAKLENLKSRVQDIKNKKLDSDFFEHLKAALDNLGEAGKKVVTPLALSVALWFCNPSSQPLTGLGVLFLSGLGSSVGFHSFLYFISVGYAVAVALPSLGMLIAYNKLSPNPIPFFTNVHTTLTLLWSFRLVSFLLHREYINWPEWHGKIVEVNQRAKLQSKFSVWMSCTLFYASLCMPCRYRMQSAFAGNKPQKWGLLGYFGITLQVFGLLVETIGDAQKAYFKSQTGNRSKWCQLGLWKYSTNPNFLGEVVFWVGTYLAGVGGFESFMHWCVSTIGLVGIIIVITGAVDQLAIKQKKAYGKDKDFKTFGETHGFFGPKLFLKSKKIKGKATPKGKSGRATSNRSRR